MKGRISNIVDQALNTINDSIVKRTATESLARVAMHTKQQPSPSPTIYNASGYNEQQYTNNATTSPTDPIINQRSGHAHAHLSDSGNITMPYNLSTQAPVTQQTTTYDHPSYIKTDEESSLNVSHSMGLGAVTGTTSQAPANTYAYSQVSNTQQPTYAAHSYNPQDWRQWSQTYMQQPVGSTGEYLNTATTLISLGGRDSTSQDNNHGDDHGQHMDHAHLAHYHWPNVAFPGAANGASHHH